ncbi:hypothetical protein FQN54_006987 [Arachnomyces sp. PD_36]|nr:hypothetical protein FQN54_006987 [Arachnomyces sp. PD_36]
MLSDAMAGQNPAHSPPVEDLASINEVAGDASAQRSDSNPRPPSTSQNATPNTHPSKTDKPRPHVCGTCQRSFARLEHLKRHERSHTKEKPFECPECTRCFARRDLLLRHQQKLHMATTPAPRPRNTRRESTSGAQGGSRIRKNSVANSGSNSMRPRANTISHVDGATMGLINGNSSSVQRSSHPTHTHHPSLSSIPSVPNIDFRGMGSGQNSVANGLSKLDTSALPMDMANGLRTAPVYGSLIPDFSMHDMMMGHAPNTINPAQLHFASSPHGLPDNPASPFNQNFSMSNTGGMLDEDPNFDFVNGFDTTLSFANANNESAVDGSSPSAMSTGSQSGISEVMLDGSGHHMATSSSAWQNPLLAQTQAPSNHYTMDFSPTSFPDMVPPETVSPKSLMGHSQFGDTSFSTPPPLSSMDQSMMSGMPNSMFHPPMVANGDSNIQQNQMRSPTGTPASTDTFTDTTRQALLTSLSQPSTFNHRKYSQQSNGNNAASPGYMSARQTNNFNSTYLLPSTLDLQRYINSYIKYFHPHMPFLHIPSLDFENSGFASNQSPNGHQNMNSSGATAGGGCLILSMAAIGALYEFDHANSKDLFESAKKMIQVYLEERRKADMSAAISRTSSVPARENSVHNTPLWLVQAMLLNVIYGHNSCDKTSADIASTHCAALVSLARAAELTKSLPPESLPSDHLGYGSSNDNMQMNGGPSDSWNSGQFEPPRERREWLNWKMVEERKRTLYAIFTLSSLLVSAYNHAPALTNSEIDLNLPCDEELWAAESPQAWRMMGGLAAAEQKSIPFSKALTSLLTASQRQQYRSSSTQHVPFGSSVHLEDLPPTDIKPSTFGCLVLIHALHNYIWETRQRHMGRQWTAQETEAMHSHIEPALRAWQSAWASNPTHDIKRPNPNGVGPLSADCIPLLDLAYVRLFVNLGRSKEAFWQRDWNAMADELARGSEVIQLGDDHTFNNTGLNSQVQSHSPLQDAMVDYTSGDLTLSQTPTQEQPMPTISPNISRQASKREQHLRRAAFYAADSLGMSDKIGCTFAEFTSRELPLQCAMCTFDCSQVLAEWATTLQERIGPYIGILGQDAIDLTQVPGIMLLEEEDIKLLGKIDAILASIERKMEQEAQSTKTMAAIGALKRAPSAVEGGYGSKILVVTAYLLDRAAVWPVTKLMARSLETQAMRMKERGDNSLILAG